MVSMGKILGRLCKIRELLTLSPLMTSVLVMQLWLHVISWRNPFEGRFCVSKKSEVGGQ